MPEATASLIAVTVFALCTFPAFAGDNGSPDLKRLKSVPLDTVLPCEADAPDKAYYSYLEDGRSGVVVILCEDGKLSALVGERRKTGTVGESAGHDDVWRP